MPEFPVEEPGYVGGGGEEEGEEGGGVVPGEADAAFGGGRVKWIGCGVGGGEVTGLLWRWRPRTGCHCGEVGEFQKGCLARRW